MDKQVVALFIPIMALAIPVAAILVGGRVKVAKMRLEEARMRSGGLGEGAEAELGAMRQEMDDVRRELAEVQERLDFAERLLARPQGDVRER